MIVLLTDCEKCLRKEGCKNKGNAKEAKERLECTMYSYRPGEDWYWPGMSDYNNVKITFSCPDFIKQRRKQ